MTEKRDLGVLFHFLGNKGQLISKCLFGVFKSSKRANKKVSRISALASKKRSNKKRLFIQLIGGFYFVSLILLFFKFRCSFRRFEDTKRTF